MSGTLHVSGWGWMVQGKDLLAIPLRFSSVYPMNIAPLATHRKQADTPQVTAPKRSSQSWPYWSTT